MIMDINGITFKSIFLSVLMAIFLADLGQPVSECHSELLLELRIMEVVVTTGAIRCAKL